MGCLRVYHVYKLGHILKFLVFLSIWSTILVYSTSKETIETDDVYEVTSQSKEIKESGNQGALGTNSLIGPNHITGSENQGDSGRRILIGSDHCLSFPLTGTIFKGTNTVLRRNNVRMCHLKTFGNELAEECREDFMDFQHNITFLLNSPSLMWFQEELVVTLRLRLNPVPRVNPHYYWGYRGQHLYVRTFDKHLNPTGRRRVITFRTPEVPKHHRHRTGPHDARLVFLR